MNVWRAGRPPAQILYLKVYTTVTVRPFGSEQPVTRDLAAIHHRFQQVPDLRHRRGVRYPPTVLLTLALWAKLTGSRQMRAIAE